MSTPGVNGPHKWTFRFTNHILNAPVLVLQAFGEFSLTMEGFLLSRVGQKWPKVSVEGKWRAKASKEILIIPNNHTNHLLRLNGGRCSLYAPHVTAKSRSNLDYYFSGSENGMTTVYSRDKGISLQIKDEEYNPNGEYSHMTYDPRTGVSIDSIMRLKIS
jgi:hypothetical protein